MAPQVEDGRYPVKRTVGDRVEVSADVFRDGHEILGAAVRYRAPGERRWAEALMHHLGNDRWVGHFEPDIAGRWHFRIDAWVDRFASWRWELQRKADAGFDDLSSEFSEGAALFGVPSLTVEEALANLESDRSELVSSAPLSLDVDRERARFGAWYELFPRSWGGFEGVERALPQLRFVRSRLRARGAERRDGRLKRRRSSRLPAGVRRCASAFGSSPTSGRSGA